jgi:hypothetical protein
MRYRRGETPRTYYRADDRCFTSDDKWYFATREGVDVGPYATREAAKAGIGRLIMLLEDAKGDPDAAMKIIQDFVFML